LILHPAFIAQQQATTRATTNLIHQQVESNSYHLIQRIAMTPNSPRNQLSFTKLYLDDDKYKEHEDDDDKQTDRLYFCRSKSNHLNG
jgi:hypothetical protein